MSRPKAAIRLSYCVLISLCLFKGPSYGQEISIGLVTPLGLIGQQLRNGAFQAVSDINQSGGIKGAKLHLVAIDDKCEPVSAKETVNRLATQYRVRAVVGNYCDQSILGAIEAYHKNNLLFIAPYASSPDITSPSFPTIFRIAGNGAAIGRYGAAEVVDKLKSKDLLIVQTEILPSHEYKTFAATIRGYGVQVAARDAVSLIPKSFDDVVYFSGEMSKAVQAAREREKLKQTYPLFVGSMPPGSEMQFIKEAGDAAVGIRFLQSNPLQRDSAATVVKAMESRGIDPSGVTLHSYAAIQIVAKALEATGITANGQQLANTIRRERFNTVLGLKTFSPSGEALPIDIQMFEFVKDNKTGKTRINAVSPNPNCDCQKDKDKPECIEYCKD
jgi:branched-chain amino acid transport system substrate-binding protein